MNPTEEWAKAEAVNVVAAIRGLGKDPCEWPVTGMPFEQVESLVIALRDSFPDAHYSYFDQRDILEIAGWQATPSPDEPKRIRWREFL